MADQESQSFPLDAQGDERAPDSERLSLDEPRAEPVAADLGLLMGDVIWSLCFPGFGPDFGVRLSR